MSEYIDRGAVTELLSNVCTECRKECEDSDGFYADCAQCMIHGAKEKIAAMPVANVCMAKWISVTEELPPPHKNVLCCGARGGIFVGWCIKQYDTDVDGNTTTFYVHGGNGRQVTYWMPLPEPPKRGDT